MRGRKETVWSGHHEGGSWYDGGSAVGGAWVDNSRHWWSANNSHPSDLISTEYKGTLPAGQGQHSVQSLQSRPPGRVGENKNVGRANTRSARYDLSSLVRRAKMPSFCPCLDLISLHSKGGPRGKIDHCTWSAQRDGDFEIPSLPCPVKCLPDRPPCLHDV